MSLLPREAFGKPDVVQQTLKVALAVFLYQEGDGFAWKSVRIS